MEVYAAFMEHTDHHVGRLIDALKDMEILDDTLIYLIIGDNGASAEGTLQGAFNEMANFNGMPELETPEFMMSKLDEFGGEGSYGHYAVGWAWAMNSPYQWTKQVASHWGGTRNGTIVHWPKGIKEKGGIAQPVQPRHRPRADGAGSGRPARADNGQRRNAEPVRRHQHALSVQRRQGGGAARDAVLRDVLQPRRLSQGLERGDQAPHAVDDGWPEDGGLRRRRVGAVRRHQGLDAVQGSGEGDAREAPRAAAALADRSDQVQRASARRPADRAHQLRSGRPAGARQGQLTVALRGHGPSVGEQRAQHQEQVVLGDRRSGGAGEGRRGCAHRAGRPVRRLEPVHQGRQGEVLLQRARHQVVHRRGDQACCDRQDAGAHGVRLRRRRHGQGRRSHALLRRQGSGKGRVEQTQGFIFSADETTDIGYESGTTVSPDYTAHTSQFNGKIKWVQIDLGKDAEDADHFISADERIRVAMARQ